MHNHDGAAVAVEERMPIREIAHHLAGLARQKRLVLADPQGVIDGNLCVIGMSEEHGTFGDGDVGRCLRTVLARPRVDIPEKRFVGFENIAVGKWVDAGSLLSGSLRAILQDRLAA